MNRTELAIRAHKNARKKGFWENSPSQKHFIALIISELGEAVEADRKGKRANPKRYDAILSGKDLDTANSDDCKHLTLEDMKATAQAQDRNLWEIAFEDCIKDTLEDELADTYIRLLDLYAGRVYELYKDWDKDKDKDKDKGKAWDRAWSIVQDSLITWRFDEQVQRIKEYFKEADYIHYVRLYNLVCSVCKELTCSIDEGGIDKALALIELHAEFKGIDLEWHINEKMAYNAQRPEKHGKAY